MRAAILQSIIEKIKKETLKQLLEKLGKLEGLEYQIAYKKDLERGKSSNQIAEEVKYSE